jgi:transcriptional regulator with XRE-family HTH domain
MRAYPQPHPARALFAARRLRQCDFATQYGFSAHTVSRTLNGYVPPTPRFRQSLAEFLDTPEEELFSPEAVTPEALAQAVLELVRRSTAVSFVPEHVEDPAVLGRIAELIRPSAP